MAQIRITSARLETIKSRQWQDRWGADYVPAIFATPTEAPGISIPCTLRPAKLGGRAFATLSQPETWAALLALHHPNVWDIHEQRILYPTSRPHFLYGHPRAGGMSFPQFAGTVDVMDRMGILNKHPKVRWRRGTDPRSWPMVPFPYIGDFLLFPEDEAGSYCLNWTIKDKYKNFRRRGPHPKGKARLDADDAGAIERHAMEATYYLDAAIPTRQIAGEAIDFKLRCNLVALFGDHAWVIDTGDETRQRVMDVYRSGIGADVRAYTLAREVSCRFDVSEREAVVLLRQGIWRRELRVDLFRPLLMDKPLWPEVEDVFKRYAHWFAR